MALIQIEQDSPDTVAQARWRIQEMVQRVADSDSDQYRHGEVMYLTGWINGLLAFHLLSVQQALALQDEAKQAADRAWTTGQLPAPCT